MAYTTFVANSGLPFLPLVRYTASLVKPVILGGGKLWFLPTTKVSNITPPASTGRPIVGQLFPLGMFFGGKGVGSLQMQVFTGSSGTFTFPPGVTQVKARIWAAGGGGGAGISTSVAGGSGGGGGGYCEGIIIKGSNTTLAIVNGTGGSAGVSTTAGGNGGDSTITATGISVTCQGGRGGIFATSTTPILGGAGGTATGLSMAINGADGGEGYTYGPSNAAKGFAGGSFGSPSGTFGSSPGAGGSGGANGSSGLSGHAGLTIIEWEE